MLGIWTISFVWKLIRIGSLQSTRKCKKVYNIKNVTFFFIFSKILGSDLETFKPRNWIQGRNEVQIHAWHSCRFSSVGPPWSLEKLSQMVSRFSGETQISSNFCRKTRISFANSRQYIPDSLAEKIQPLRVKSLAFLWYLFLFFGLLKLCAYVSRKRKRIFGSLLLVKQF